MLCIYFSQSHIITKIIGYTDTVCRVMLTVTLPQCNGVTVTEVLCTSDHHCTHQSTPNSIGVYDQPSPVRRRRRWRGGLRRWRWASWSGGCSRAGRPWRSAPPRARAPPAARGSRTPRSPSGCTAELKEFAYYALKGHFSRYRGPMAMALELHVKSAVNSSYS